MDLAGPDRLRCDRDEGPDGLRGVPVPGIPLRDMIADLPFSAADQIGRRNAGTELWLGKDTGMEISIR